MLDYLGRLALRFQQPEMTVQPRPVSRFESQRHSIRTALELPAPEEAGELGLQSSVFVPAETNTGRMTQPADSWTQGDPDILDTLSERQPTKNYHNLYPGQSTVAPAIGTPTSSTETTDLPVLEVTQLVPHGQQAEQSEQSVRSTVVQAQPSVRIGKRAFATPVIATSASSAETTGVPVLEVPHPASDGQQAEQSEQTVRSAAAQAQPSGRIDGLEEQTSNVSRLKITNPKEERASSLSTQPMNRNERGMFSELPETESLYGRKTDTVPRTVSTPVTRREMTERLAHPTAQQFGTNRATDEPTIQVTIGRVEIRATVASAPTRKTQTQRPVMSLDEYLRQRNGSRG